MFIQYNGTVADFCPNLNSSISEEMDLIMEIFDLENPNVMFSLEGSDKALAIDVPLSSQGVNDYSVIEVTDLPKSQSPIDLQTLSESSAYTHSVDGISRCAEDSKEEDDQITLVCDCGHTVEYLCRPSSKIMTVFKYFISHKFGRVLPDEEINEYCLVTAHNSNTPLSLRKTVRDCGLSDGDEVIVCKKPMKPVSQPKPESICLRCYVGTMESVWCQKDWLVERVFLHFLTQHLKRPLTVRDRGDYFLAHQKTPNEPIPLNNTVGDCNFFDNELLKLVNVSELSNQQNIVYITVTSISDKPFSYRVPVDTLLEHVFLYFLEKRLGHESTAKDRKENCLVRISQPNEPLPLDKTLAQCQIRDQERLEIRLVASLKPHEKPVSKITLYFGSDKSITFSAPVIMAVRTVFKYFLRGHLNHPLTSTEEKEWYIARVRAENRPLPLDKTVQECGLKDGECLICKKWDELNKKNQKEKKGIKIENKSSLPKGTPSQQIVVHDVITGHTIPHLSSDTLVATVFDVFLKLQGDKAMKNRSAFSLVRASDGTRPLPLEKTLSECGIQDGEKLAIRKKETAIVKPKATVNTPKVTPQKPQTPQTSQTPQTTPSNERVIILVMNVGGLIYYNSKSTETIKSVMKYFYELRFKRPATNDDLKLFSLVRSSLPDQPLGKKKTVEECGLTDYTMVELKAIPGASVSSTVILTPKPVPVLTPKPSSKIPITPVPRSGTLPPLAPAPRKTSNLIQAPAPKSVAKPQQAPTPSVKPLHLFCDHGKRCSVSFLPTTLIQDVLLKLVKKYWDADVTDKTLGEYCLVNIQDIHKPLPLMKTLSQCGVENEMTLTVRKTSKLTAKKTITVFMNIMGNVYYECSLDQSIKSVMEHFLEIRLNHKPSKEEMAEMCIVDFAKPSSPLPLHKTVRQCGIKDGAHLEIRSLNKVKKPKNKKKTKTGNPGKGKPEIDFPKDFPYADAEVDEYDSDSSDSSDSYTNTSDTLSRLIDSFMSELTKNH